MSPALGQKKEWCLRGHHKPTVGTRSNGWCYECYKISYASKERRPGSPPDPDNIRFRSPVCVRGHDKRVVGVTKDYLCRGCKHERSAGNSLKIRRRRAGINADPGPVPNLRQIRLKAGLTQGEMASRVGVSKKHIADLEAGARRAGRKTLAKITAAVSELMAARGSMARTRGRYGRLLTALAEAERRANPTAAQVRDIAFPEEQAVVVGSLLRWARAEGLVYRCEEGGRPQWHLTLAARQRLGVAA